MTAWCGGRRTAPQLVNWDVITRICVYASCHDETEKLQPANHEQSIKFHGGLWLRSSSAGAGVGILNKRS
jgi:hypothetical protein